MKLPAWACHVLLERNVPNQRQQALADPNCSTRSPATLAADMWAAVKASGKATGYSGAAGREAAARAASPSPPHGRRCSAAAASIAAIMGRSATAFGRRATQPRGQAPPTDH